MKKKSLKWGETPWDKMKKPELLREVWRMYSALRSLYSVVKMDAATSTNPYFYSKTGVGGNALEKGRQIIEPLFRQYKEGESDIFRSFFRYADDLLFDQSVGYTMIGSRWTVCPECGVMIGDNPKGESSVGKPCHMGKKDCAGIMRPLLWDDLRKDGK